jgi:hypothetical protein
MALFEIVLMEMPLCDQWYCGISNNQYKLALYTSTSRRVGAITRVAMAQVAFKGS